MKINWIVQRKKMGEIKMASKHMEKNVQLPRTTLRFHLTSVKVAVMQQTNAGDMGKEELLDSAGANANQYLDYGG